MNQTASKKILDTDTVLLTGAGFTHNFGGLLADDMWSLIFNHEEIQSRPHIQELMINGDFDYESVYQNIVKEKSTDVKDKKAIMKAVFEAYRNVDERIVDLHNYTKVIGLVKSLLTKMKYFFTLNQDILVERFVSSLEYIGGRQIILPGVDITSICNVHKHCFNDSFFIKLVDLVSDADFADKDKLFYIKLHGSFNWKRSVGGEIHEVMVLGHNKKDPINDDPLLSRYFSLFESVLKEETKNLLVIGYGFRDDHINKVILDAIKEKGLRLFVISPEKPREFVFKFEDKMPKYRNIVDGLAGYYPYDLKELSKPENYAPLFRSLSID